MTSLAIITATGSPLPVVAETENALAVVTARLAEAEKHYQEHVPSQQVEVDDSYYKNWSWDNKLPEVIAEAMSRQNNHKDQWCVCGHRGFAHESNIACCAGNHGNSFSWTFGDYRGHDDCSCVRFTAASDEQEEIFEQKELQSILDGKREHLISAQLVLIDAITEKAEMEEEYKTVSSSMTSLDLEKLAAKETFLHDVVFIIADVQVEIVKAERNVDALTKEVRQAESALTRHLEATQEATQEAADVRSGMTSDEVFWARVKRSDAKRQGQPLPLKKHAESYIEFMLSLGSRRSFTELTMQEHFDKLMWETNPAAKARVNTLLNKMEHEGLRMAA